MPEDLSDRHDIECQAAPMGTITETNLKREKRLKIKKKKIAEVQKALLIGIVCNLGDLTVIECFWWKVGILNNK